VIAVRSQLVAATIGFLVILFIGDLVTNRLVPETFVLGALSAIS
jgi:hypothetical protein